LQKKECAENRVCRQGRARDQFTPAIKEGAFTELRLKSNQHFDEIRYFMGKSRIWIMKPDFPIEHPIWRIRKPHPPKFEDIIACWWEGSSSLSG